MHSQCWVLCVLLFSALPEKSVAFTAGPALGMVGMMPLVHKPPSYRLSSSLVGRRPRCFSAPPLEMSGFFSNLFGGDDDQDRESFDRVVSAITAPGGWSVNLEIGSEIARSLGGSGSLAKGDVMNVNIGVAVRMTMDEGYDPPQGSVFVDSESSIFAGESFWSVTEDTDSGVPTAIQASLKCPQGIKVSGDLVVPEGEIFLNFRIKDEISNQIKAQDESAQSSSTQSSSTVTKGAVELYSGRVTVKENLKSSFLLTSYDGLLAEFKIVGTCSAKPRAPAAPVSAGTDST